jgi:hypothetical protein
MDIITAKKVVSQTQKGASKRYYEKVKNTEKYIETRNKNMKSYHKRNGGLLLASEVLHDVHFDAIT